jgi:subtilisin-like proprotein convertase family protein
VRFVSFNAFGEALISEIPPGRTVFSGYPMIQGVVVVSAMSSRKRKAGYSSWGPHVTVTAPSNNMHYIQSFITPGSDARRDEYLADYRGLGQVAGCNRPGQGQAFSPIQRFDDLSTPALEENFYTKKFGGTSGAAPVVTGIVALVLSVNPQLTAQEVRQILMGTADTDLDPTLDLANDPNVQGLSGAFVNGSSLFFGAGKVNAFRAVSRARDLNGNGGGGGGDTPAPAGTLSGEARPNLAIPDNQPQGVVSQIDISGTGQLHAITVTVDITHSWRGDLRVTLIAPGGFPAVLHNMSGGSAKHLKRIYTADTRPDLENLVRGHIGVQGSWTLHVADNVQRDVGQLNFWRLELAAS